MPLTDFEVSASAIDGLAIMRTKQISDERGIVREFFRASVHSDFAPSGLASCAQLNVTYTKKGAIRGLHGEDMTKLVGVVAGEAFGAYVDARPDSLTFGVVATVALRVGIQVLVPKGVLNGFQAVSDGGCEYLYGFDAEWRSDMPGLGASALDPALAIPWPVEISPADPSLLSAKDASLPLFAQLLF
ncbi:MAG: dTDP-4-dehydrorhamnose 3,5-epimerase family protein [Acidimicrobiales bacterium]